MRYYVDTAYDVEGDKLLSLALVPADRKLHNLYLISNDLEVEDEWVRAHLVSVIKVPLAERTHRFHVDPQFFGNALSHYLYGDAAPFIIANGIDCISHFCDAVKRGLGMPGRFNTMDFKAVTAELYPTTLEGAVKNNSLWDALALREVLSVQ